ncbi:MAG: oxygenase MpaB family protein [Ilumatobacteraceae bacterium]
MAEYPTNMQIQRISDAIIKVRQEISKALRSRVAGPNAEERMIQILATEGRRWFADDRPIRLVHRDASMFIGGLRALLLQSLHPLAMAGVAQHSDFKNDPWGRLQRTADFLVTTTFGSDAEAQRVVDRVASVHRHVHGLASDGRPYSASDPHLLRWVHLVEVDSFLSVYQRYGSYPLDQTSRDEYVSDMAVIARALNIPAPPQSEQALADQIRSYRHELRSTPESRDTLRYLILQPPLPLLARAAYSVLVAATVATLPRWSRPMLGFPYLPITEAIALRPLGGGITRVFRWATSLNSPYARDAEERARSTKAS